ncbi:hypothetical protein, partial [Frankia casuarinae]
MSPVLDVTALRSFVT